MEKLRRYWVPQIVDHPFENWTPVYLASDLAERRKQAREALAAYAHEAWAGWMKYQRERCLDAWAHLPEWARQRWERQMDTEYKDLPQEEKESDRAEADRIGDICFGEEER